MRNIINSQQQQTRDLTVLRYQNAELIIGSVNLTPDLPITANGQVVFGFVQYKAISHPLQNPIKNIICYPE